MTEKEFIDQKKRSRKWLVVNTMLKSAVIITIVFCVLMFIAPKSVETTSLVWTTLLGILWGGPAAYAGIGQARVKPIITNNDK